MKKIVIFIALIVLISYLVNAASPIFSLTKQQGDLLYCPISLCGGGSSSSSSISYIYMANCLTDANGICWYNMSASPDTIAIFYLGDSDYYYFGG